MKKVAMLLFCLVMFVGFSSTAFASQAGTQRPAGVSSLDSQASLNLPLEVASYRSLLHGNIAKSLKASKHYRNLLCETTVDREAERIISILADLEREMTVLVASLMASSGEITELLNETS